MCLSLLEISLCMCVSVRVRVCMCVCVSLVSGDKMSCLPIVSDRAATEGSKYFELGREPHEFLTRNTCTIAKVLPDLYICKWLCLGNIVLTWPDHL